MIPYVRMGTVCFGPFNRTLEGIVMAWWKDFQHELRKGFVRLPDGRVVPIGSGPGMAKYLGTVTHVDVPLGEEKARRDAELEEDKRKNGGKGRMKKCAVPPWQKDPSMILEMIQVDDGKITVLRVDDPTVGPQMIVSQTKRDKSAPRIYLGSQFDMSRLDEILAEARAELREHFRKAPGVRI